MVACGMNMMRDRQKETQLTKFSSANEIICWFSLMYAALLLWRKDKFSPIVGCVKFREEYHDSYQTHS